MAPLRQLVGAVGGIRKNLQDPRFFRTNSKRFSLRVASNQMRYSEYGGTGDGPIGIPMGEINVKFELTVEIAD
jgi:hypothetical protein